MRYYKDLRISYSLIKGITSYLESNIDLYEKQTLIKYSFPFNIFTIQTKALYDEMKKYKKLGGKKDLSYFENVYETCLKIIKENKDKIDLKIFFVKEVINEKL